MIRQLKREIHREPLSIATDLLIEPRSRDSIKPGQIRVKQYALAAHYKNSLGNYGRISLANG